MPEEENEIAGPQPTWPPLRQPRPWLRWIAVVLAAAGWYLSFNLARVSASGGQLTGLVEAVCGGQGTGVAGCSAVLTSQHAYIPLGTTEGSVRLPSAVLGMAYFAIVGLWYLFIGPPTKDRRLWHLVILALVLIGAGQSLDYIRIMGSVLHQWCGGCLVAHAINGGLLVVTLAAWPWRRPRQAVRPHPSARLVLATTTAGALAFTLHLATTYVAVAGSVLKERRDQYGAVLNDPAFIVWDFRRQPQQEIPLRDDEYFAGNPQATHTVVIFSDFQCTHCRRLHETLKKLLAEHGDALRIVYRHYPQDPACNPRPEYRAGGHASACQAARAALAARQVGGDAAYARMCDLLFDRQDELPKRPYVEQSPAERQRFADWAAEIGLDRDQFMVAMDSEGVAQRVQQDIALADTLDAHAMPAVFLDGRRLRNWSRLDVWSTLLEASPATTQPGITQPATSPAEVGQR